jgi:hypothetical protein
MTAVATGMECLAHCSGVMAACTSVTLNFLHFIVTQHIRFIRLVVAGSTGDIFICPGLTLKMAIAAICRLNIFPCFVTAGALVGLNVQKICVG